MVIVTFCVGDVEFWTRAWKQQTVIQNLQGSLFQQ